MSDMNIRNIDKGLLIRVKSIGVSESRSLRDVVTEALERYVAEKQGVKENEPRKI